MIVLDASAAVELLLSTPAGARVAARLASVSEILYAPFLLDIEVAQVLRRLARTGDITATDAESALDTLVAFAIERVAHEPLLGRVWALRHNLTAYDACYIALAEALGAELLTCDGELEGAGGHDAKVVVA